MLHRTRHLFIRQQTAVINAIRAHLAEFGIVAQSDAMVSRNCSVVADPSDKRVPEIARACLAALGASCGCSRRRSWSSTVGSTLAPIQDEQAAR